MYEPQPDLEEKDNHSILQDYFSSRTDPTIFTSIALLTFSSTNSTNHFLPQSTVFRIFFLIWFHSMQGWTATKMNGVNKKKKYKKIEA